MKKTDGSDKSQLVDKIRVIKRYVGKNDGRSPEVNEVPNENSFTHDHKKVTSRQNKLKKE